MVGRVTPQAAAPTSGLSFPPDLTGVTDNYMTFRFEKYRRRSISAPPVTEIDGPAIRLPIPNNLKDAFSVSYGNENLGLVVGAALESLVSQGSTPPSGFQDTVDRFTGAVRNNASSIAAAAALMAIGNAANTVTGAISSIPGVGGAAAAALRGATRGLPAAASQYTGIGINPYMTVMFKHPEYKEHQFEWKFVPRNQEESRIVAAIIKKFKTSMLPSLNTSLASNQTTNLLFDYPDVVKITISPANEYMYKFKTCVVKNLVVNYAPGNSPSFFNYTHAPTAITMSMHLGEIEYWTQRDFNTPAPNPTNGRFSGPI